MFPLNTMNEFTVFNDFVKNSTKVALNGSNRIVLKETILPGDSLVVEYTEQ